MNKKLKNTILVALALLLWLSYFYLNAVPLAAPFIYADF